MPRMAVRAWLHEIGPVASLASVIEPTDILATAQYSGKTLGMISAYSWRRSTTEVE